MKNIHVLPTPKPSRLYKEDSVYKLDNLVYGTGNQNIYITSDEEIKEGDWVFQECLNMPHRLIKADTENVKVLNDLNKCKKIILTDNKDLIKDGVQAIDDEFLEWFVKNPTCEYVEVELEPLFPMYRTFIEDIDTPPFYGNLKRKIIIPKEEPKQDKKMYSEEEVLEILREFYKVASLKDFPLVTTIPLWFEQFKNK